MSLPPWMRPPYVKKPKHRTYQDDTGERAAYNIDKANNNLDEEYRIRD